MQFSDLLQTGTKFTDSRVPFPSNLNYTQLYCFNGGAQSETFLPSYFIEKTAVARTSTRQIFVPCNKTSDCSGEATSSTPYCFQGICRECMNVNNCTSSPSLFCNAETSFTCSECRTDTDCSGGKICRMVFGSSVNRKRCVACTNAQVPKGAIVNETASCSWFCLGSQTLNSDGACAACPVCSSGQMLIPSSDFALATPNSFFPACQGSSDPRCVACPGQNNGCATQLSPSFDYSKQVFVGKLPPQFPCQYFTCNEGWFLDRAINQCRRCELRSCPSGKYLADCAGVSAGTCTACPAQADPNIPFIDPRSSAYSVKTALDVCVPNCPAGTYMNKPSPSLPWYCSPCSTSSSAASCSLGYFFSGCGGPNSGSCLLCASQPMANTYWSNSGNCEVAACEPSTCLPGTFLAGCGGTSAGICQTCPYALPSNSAGYVAVFNQVTQTTDTCGVQCDTGFFVSRSSTNQYVCNACNPAACPAGQQLVECGKDNPGRCIACPQPQAGWYASPAPGRPCATSLCAKDSSGCDPGKYFTGCGGSSAGSCVSCGTSLPAGAASWKQVTPGSALTCDVTCQNNFTPIVNGTITQCVSCSSIANQCGPGTQLVGCSSNSSGFCQSCPPLAAGTYWTPGSSSCGSSSCSSYVCPLAGEHAVGCGGSFPGTCVSCGTLPVGAAGWSVSNNVCAAVCEAGFFLDASSGNCGKCNLNFCAKGQVLMNCGGSSPGICQSCNALQTGQCFTGFGSVMNNRNSCPNSPCTTTTTSTSTTRAPTTTTTTTRAPTTTTRKPTTTTTRKPFR